MFLLMLSILLFVSFIFPKHLLTEIFKCIRIPEDYHYKYIVLVQFEYKPLSLSQRKHWQSTLATEMLKN